VTRITARFFGEEWNWSDIRPMATPSKTEFESIRRNKVYEEVARQI
jgi:hypothetical protein